MKNTTAPNRKTGRMIAKNLIILLVVVLVATLAIWAWFTKGQTALADGINLSSKAEGVEVSWDENGEYYENLTALTAGDVIEGDVGLAKKLDPNLASLKLITGNGESFFEPLLNRRTGEVILNEDGSWNGSDITPENSEGKYIDVDLFFRSEVEKTIYLSGDSRVTPKNTDERLSEYGNFSKDYICSAARVAFLNENGDCNFIWAPNSDYELKENASGYTKYTKVDTETIQISGGGGSGLDGGAEDDGKQYYLWTYEDKPISSYPNNFDDFEARPFTYDSSIRYFVTEFTFYVPTYSNPSTIPLIINNTADRNMINSSDMDYIKGADSKAISKENQFFYVTDTNFNIGNMNCTNGMYGNAEYISNGDHMTVKFGYNPQTGILTILSYDNGNGQSFDLGGGGSPITQEVKYYEIDNDTNLSLVNAGNAKAVSSNNNTVKPVSFKAPGTTNVLPASITQNEIFTAKKGGGDKSKATYQFVNMANNRYLTITGSGVSYTPNSGTDFYLKYVEGISGPVLQTANNMCLVYQKGGFVLVSADKVTESNFVTIYTGSSYEFLTGSSTESHTFYKSGNTALSPLDSTTVPPLFSTKSTETSATVIGKVSSTKSIPVATLAKEKETDRYFTAHIIIRIWAEGTDRDALTPLAGGMFETMLHFTSTLPKIS